MVMVDFENKIPAINILTYQCDDPRQLQAANKFRFRFKQPGNRDFKFEFGKRPHWRQQPLELEGAR